MAILSSAPTPQRFAQAWIQAFTNAVTQAAGRDGRLTAASALRLLKSSGPEQLFADNILNYLTAKGQKSVSATKLIMVADAYAQRSTTQAAGPDNRLSLLDGAKLPEDLRADFLYLRGKKVYDADGRTKDQWAADVRAEV